ncbi:EscU/YscU/HrcU family type III secretion system export apparatus switch protein [Clostridiisalibacter paucivorans]|uniref:EscU/YscU/HrcU family type III secretion system export apparatus switch protein n=1 Tax=Clostridiisalibacter paucivorans TaxID=408753 RepID=UPI000478AB01|nr:EscU/YscU/HrcU family type III secretion system export apparatus switch protein [Clostridiisalibacter paucivorans]
MSNKKNKNKIAIALQYKKDYISPKIIAKGKGIVADNIIDKGKKSNVKVHENKEVARELMDIDIGGNIPEELYNAVASILAFVYELDEKWGQLDEI